MVEAAGIEPFLRVNSNLMMAHDLGFYKLKTIELRSCFFSPGVPSCPLESSPVLEIYWRRRHHVERHRVLITITRRTLTVFTSGHRHRSQLIHRATKAMISAAKIGCVECVLRLGFDPADRQSSHRYEPYEWRVTAVDSTSPRAFLVYNNVRASNTVCETGAG